MKNPTHHGPHYAGLCEGQAYSSRIRELERELALARKARIDGMEQAVRTWHATAKATGEAVDELNNVIGCSPESPLSQAIYAMVIAYTDAVQDAHGLGDWLNWYWLECEMGTEPLSASIGDEPLREIATVEDLIALCARHCDNGGQGI